MVVRFFLLSTHYRSPVDFSDEQLISAREAYRGLVNLIGDIDFLVSKSSKFQVLGSKSDIAAFKNDFLEAMDDDFNTAGALAIIFNMVSLLNKQVRAGGYDAKLKTLLLDLLEIIGIRLPKEEKLLPEEDEMIKEREIARKNKDFAKADAIKLELEKKWIILKDTPYGTQWSKKQPSDIIDFQRSHI
jgi:cysteinyl-tRNA synthetase